MVRVAWVIGVVRMVKVVGVVIIMGMVWGVRVVGVAGLKSEIYEFRNFMNTRS